MLTTRLLWSFLQPALPSLAGYMTGFSRWRVAKKKYISDANFAYLSISHLGKVQIFWESHIILRNLHHRFNHFYSQLCQVWLAIWPGFHGGALQKKNIYQMRILLTYLLVTLVKFRYSEKATKFCEISTLDLTFFRIRVVILRNIFGLPTKLQL